MIGPIFRLELLRQSRRGRQHTFRWVYAGWLVLEFVFLYLSYRVNSRKIDPAATGHFIASFIELFAVQQYVLLLLVTPAFAAGTISDDRTRGTLADLLITPLSSAEIVAGKLLAQVVRVLDLALVGLPLLAFAGAVGRVERSLVLAVFLSPLLPLVAVASASLLASVACRTTREAVAVLYLCGALGFLAAWVFGGLEYFDPRYVLTPAWEHAQWREWGRRWLETGRLWAVVALVCFGFAVRRLRPSFARQGWAFRRDSTARRWHPPVGDRPIYWKERYAKRLPMLRALPRWAGLPAAFLLGTAGTALITDDLFVGPEPRWSLLGLGSAILAGLLGAVRCSGTITDERERQTWDILLTTPLEPSELLRDRFWGAMHSGRLFLILSALPACLLALLFEDPQGVVLVISWWLIAWAVMYYMSACGIEASVRSAGSWQALLATLSIGSRQLVIIFIPLCLIGLALGCFLVMALWLAIQILDGAFGTKIDPMMGDYAVDLLYFRVGPGIAFAVLLIAAAKERLHFAEEYLKREERATQPSPGEPVPVESKG